MFMFMQLLTAIPRSPWTPWGPCGPAGPCAQIKKAIIIIYMYTLMTINVKLIAHTKARRHLKLF